MLVLLAAPPAPVNERFVYLGAQTCQTLLLTGRPLARPLFEALPQITMYFLYQHHVVIAPKKRMLLLLLNSAAFGAHQRGKMGENFTFYAGVTLAIAVIVVCFPCVSSCGGWLHVWRDAAETSDK